MSVIKSLIVGAVFGAGFSYFKLFIPVPNAIEGIVGIIGLYIGFKVVQCLG